MTITTADFQAIQRDITGIFNGAAEQATPFYPTLCTTVQSNGADEKYAWLGAMPGMQEWLGPRAFTQLRAAGFTLANKLFESSLEIERTVFDDDRLGLIRPAITNLADEAMYHPDELLCANAMNLGASSECFDGQYFFDTDHSWGDSGTQSNALTHNATDHTAVTSAECRAAVEAAVVAMLGFKNDRGKPFIRPRVGKLNDLVVTCPLSMYAAMAKAFEQQVVVEGGAGVSNFTIERPQIVCVQYMGASYTNGSDVKFHLYYTGGRLKPYVFQARQPLRFQLKGSDDIEFRSLKAMTEARYNIGYLAWWCAVQTTFN